MKATPSMVVSQTYPFTVGRFDCLAISDGEMAYPIENLFSNVPAETIDRVLHQHKLPTQPITTPYACLCVSTGEHRVLVDVGAGNLAPSTGKLLGNLRSAGVEPADIDTIIITHAHPAHIGGNLDEDDRPRYVNAHYFISKEEWTYWTSKTALDNFGTNATIARRNLEPVRNRLVLLERDAEVVPGIRTVPAPGHTPGHLVVSILSDGQQLLHVADTVLSPLHLEHPDWLSVYDMLPEQAAASKQQIFDRAVVEQALVFGHHFPPFPNLGYVIKRGESWQWRSVHGGG